MAIDKIGIRHAPLSDRIVLARFGKDPNVALEKRDAMSEFWQALCSYAFGGKLPKPGTSVEIKFGGGDEQFTVLISRDEIAAEPTGSVRCSDCPPDHYPTNATRCAECPIAA